MYAIPVPFNFLYLRGDAIEGLSGGMCTTILSYNLLFLVFFLLGYLAYNRIRKPERKLLSNLKDQKILSPDILLYFSIFFSILLVFLMLYQMGGITQYFTLTRFELYKEKRDNNLGIFEVGFSYIKILIVLMLMKILFIRKFHNSQYGKYKVVLLTLLLFLYIFAVLGVGDRRPIVGLFIALVFVFSYFEKMNEKIVVLAGLPFIIVMQILQYLRHLMNDPEKMLIYLQSDYKADWLDVSKGELGNGYLIFKTLLTNPEKWDFFWGSTYFYNLTILVPKVILPIRYDGIANWFSSVFYPKTFAEGGGFGFNIVAEGYINFGVPGIAISAFILGVLVNYLWNYLCIKNVNPLKLTLYAMLLTIFFVLGRTDSGGLIKEFVVGSFLPISAIFIINYLIKQKTKYSS